MTRIEKKVDIPLTSLSKKSSVIIHDEGGILIQNAKRVTKEEIMSEAVLSVIKLPKYANIKAFLHIRSTPHKFKQVKLVNTTKTSLLLSFILVLIGVLFNEYLSIFNFINIHAELCEGSSEHLGNYTEQIKEYTNYYGAEQLWSYSEYTRDSLYAEADTVYNGELFTPGWPEPFVFDNSLLCESYTMVVTPPCAVPYPFKIFCPKSYTIVINPCIDDVYSPPDFYEIFPEWTYNETKIEIPETTTMDYFLEELVTRINYASSSYCFWSALLVFFGPGRLVSSPGMCLNIKILLTSLSKSQFIITFVSMWLLVELIINWATLFLIDSQFLLIFQLSSVDPCFADVGFVEEMYTLVYEVCSNITMMETEYISTLSEMDYYGRLEFTYLDYFTDMEPIYEYSFNEWNSSCNISTFMTFIKPIETHNNGLFYLLDSGLVAAICFQPILCNVVWHLFQIISPLSPNNGKIVFPLQEVDQGTIDTMKLHMFSYVRYSSFIPLVILFSTFMVILLDLFNILPPMY